MEEKFEIDVAFYVDLEVSNQLIILVEKTKVYELDDCFVLNIIHIFQRNNQSF